MWLCVVGLLGDRRLEILQRRGEVGRPRAGAAGVVDSRARVPAVAAVFNRGKHHPRMCNPAQKISLGVVGRELDSLVEIRPGRFMRSFLQVNTTAQNENRWFIAAVVTDGRI